MHRSGEGLLRWFEPEDYGFLGWWWFCNDCGCPLDPWERVKDIERGDYIPPGQLDIPEYKEQKRRRKR